MRTFVDVDPALILILASADLRKRARETADARHAHDFANAASLYRSAAKLIERADAILERISVAQQEAMNKIVAEGGMPF